MHVISKSILISLFLLFINIDHAFSQCNTGSPTCTLLAGSGAQVNVDKFGICRRVTNNNASTIMIPHNNANEWCGTTSGCTGGSSSNSFLERLPANVTSSSCVTISFSPILGVCGCTSSGLCSCTSATATITGSGTLAFTGDSTNYGSTIRYRLNGGAWTNIPATLSVVNGNTLQIQFFGLSCDEFASGADSVDIKEGVGGPTIGLATGQNNGFGCL